MDEKVKKTIMVVEDEESIRELFCMAIEAALDCQIIEFENAKEAIEAIVKNDDVDLIFCDYSLGSDKGSELYNFIVKEKLNIPFAICTGYGLDELTDLGNFLKGNPLNRHIPKPFSFEQIQGYIDDCLGTEKSNRYADLLPIRIESYLELNDFVKAYDISIKLKKDKFVKIADKETTDTSSMIENYRNKGLEKIYMPREQFIEFNQRLIDNLFISLIRNEGENLTKKVTYAIESIHSYVKALGVSEATIAEIDKIVIAAIKSINNNENLESLLKTIDSKQGFIKNHAYLTCYISCSIAKKMTWQTEGINKCLAMASLFQNLALNVDDEGKVQRLFGEEISKLESNVIEKIRLHPLKSVELLQKEEDFFTETTLKLIQNHHELPGGNGFPRGLDSSKVSALEALFILSSNFARDLLISKETSELGKIVESYSSQYNRSVYKKSLDAFFKAFSKLNV